jgi:hypothetical protein
MRTAELTGHTIAGVVRRPIHGIQPPGPRRVQLQMPRLRVFRGNRDPAMEGEHDHAASG